MSRVDDEREAARTAARLAEAKRTEEQKRTERAQGDQAFSRLVGDQRNQGVRTKAQQDRQQQSSARDAIKKALKEASGTERERASQESGAQSKTAARQGQEQLSGQAGAERRAQAKTDAAGREAESRDAGHEVAAQEQSAHQTAAQGGRQATSGRSSDAQSTRERLEERRESSDASKAASKGDTKGGGELKADADQGGGGQGKNDQKDGGGGGAPPGFRFNPALMAPVPVAKPKETSSSDRLRKLATEIAQKIVERVRIGTNAAGRAEFQIDLRSDVLSGLTVKVSSHQGRIKAVFSGRDREVLKMIEAQGEALKGALTARGLTLEDLKVEARS